MAMDCKVTISLIIWTFNTIQLFQSLEDARNGREKRRHDFKNRSFLISN